MEAAAAGSNEITDSLIHLYLSGRKTAGSSVVEFYRTEGVPLPQVGNYWIILDSKERPACIARTTRTTINKFMDVPVDIAIAEGEGDLSLRYWRDAHRDFFHAAYAASFKKWGVGSVDELTILTEFFEIVFPLPAARQK